MVSEFVQGLSEFEFDVDVEEDKVAKSEFKYQKDKGAESEFNVKEDKGARVTVEIPYLLIQAVIYVIITYPMIGYYGSVYKVFWNFYGMFTTLLYFNYLGMVLVSLTPNFMIASILSSVFYTLFNLFSGFLIPQPKIPKWWIWLYYLTPSSWALNGMLTSQYGDVDKDITVFGEMKQLGSFLEDYFGFYHDRLAITAVVLIAFPVVLASLFAYFIGRLNFQRSFGLNLVSALIALNIYGVYNSASCIFLLITEMGPIDMLSDVHVKLMHASGFCCLISTGLSNMAQMVNTDEIESLRIELAEIGGSLRSSFGRHNSSFRSSSRKNDIDVEHAMQWAAIDRLPTFERLKSSLFYKDDDGNLVDGIGKEVIDVTKLGALERHLFMEKLIKHIEHDNLQLLWKIRKRIDKVGVKLPTVEVRYKNLCVEAECEVVHGKPLPTLWNSLKHMLSVFTKLSGSKSHEAKINIINDVSGIIKPGRMTLLLGPPGCGKTTLLKSLSGNQDKSLKVIGEVSYNGYRLDEFVPQKTSAYISQNDLHMADMTVRETLDFSSRCQGVGSRAEIMMEVSRREKEAGIVPDPDIDTYMKILGLDICADTLVGDVMIRGISGGQKKRLTTGEMIVGPTKALFMDEITNGLDSSTAYQIVACVQQLVHITDSTSLVSLLQPAPETFDLFDDIILMAEGKIVYHGPRDNVLEFFEDCGFKCPQRKGVADFLQEVISRKDQEQYWFHTELPYNYVSVDMFSRKFKESHLGKKLNEDLSEPYDKSKSHKNALSFSMYSLSRWELFRACMSRELLLMKRNSFVYVFKTTQLIISAIITMTVFLRTRLDINVFDANYYMGALFFALILLLVDGIPELAMTLARLEVFYKQKELRFYPAWAYAIPATVLKIPLSLIESLAWTSLTYYVIGYSPEVWRFFRQFVLLFAMHFTSISMFRFVASVFQTVVASMTAASMPVWMKWGFWLSPLTYGEIGLSVNEFLAPRWQKTLSTNITIGRATLESRGLNYDEYHFWISLGALFGFALAFNIGFTLALSFLKSPGSSRAMISHETFSKIQGSEDSHEIEHAEKKFRNSPNTNKGRMVLPFEPLTVAFQDVQYYVDTPLLYYDRNVELEFECENEMLFDSRGTLIVLCVQLILLKTGGRIVYSGPLGKHSSSVIEYFEVGLSYFAMERTVMYREKFAGMYSPWAYALAQVTVEIPYLLVQAVTYVIVTYPMIGYYGSTYKIFWNFYGMFTTLLYFNYLGMVLVSLTPNFMIASILSSVFYTLFNLFAGFVIPQPKIPKWWIWLYYLTPTSWTLNGMLTSQYGDTDKEITVFGETKPIGSFLEDYFGFHHDQLAITAVVLIAFPVILASLFAYFIGRLNFLKR
ncbi:hypothetical protein EZV62_024795 [Acer yangbiense]|uniref:ABC transporter domain-containing protein n=1 Tax=Acer yangbiense TaxID=1000413 RepID=A0A5C7GW63_9ROSI|nr:hypothetical protein EZV62_024795 [Acer yangbiense]